MDAFREALNYHYDVSDGQMAFGQTSAYDNAEYWADADVHFSTKNRTHPQERCHSPVFSGDNRNGQLPRFGLALCLSLLATLWLCAPAAYADDPTFDDSGQALGIAQSRAVALGDLDGDGDLDAFVGNYHDQPNRVWLNHGCGKSGSPPAIGSSPPPGSPLS